MFKRVVTRDNGTPWPATGMTSEKWHSVPTQDISISDLIAMQDGVYFHALIEDFEHLHDTYPHVVVWDGEFYLEDGHHRAVKALLRGEKKITARVLNLSEKRTS